MTFNSLFEMQVELVSHLDASISNSFNSLFEMHLLYRDLLRELKRGPFNSLFEMHLQLDVLPVAINAFNSLFEMRTRRSATRRASPRTFQFSI